MWGKGFGIQHLGTNMSNEKRPRRYSANTQAQRDSSCWILLIVDTGILINPGRQQPLFSCPHPGT